MGNFKVLAPIWEMKRNSEYVNEKSVLKSRCDQMAHDRDDFKKKK